jgi:putative oxidoreductase
MEHPLITTSADAGTRKLPDDLLNFLPSGGGDAINRDFTDTDTALACSAGSLTGGECPPVAAATTQEISILAACEAGLDLWPSLMRSLTMKIGIERWFWLAPLGRFLLAFLFVPAGLSKVMQPQATAEFMTSAGFPPWDVLALGVGLFEIVAGVLIALGWQARWSALALALFTLFASVIFHAYWTVPADQQFVQQLLFGKNLAVVGGLCFMAAVGPGPWSIDAKVRASGRTARA